MKERYVHPEFIPPTEKRLHDMWRGCRYSLVTIGATVGDPSTLGDPRLQVDMWCTAYPTGVFSDIELPPVDTAVTSADQTELAISTGEVALAVLCDNCVYNVEPSY